jgi:hypothetical protein
VKRELAGIRTDVPFNFTLGRDMKVFHYLIYAVSIKVFIFVFRLHPLFFLPMIGTEKCAHHITKSERIYMIGLGDMNLATRRSWFILSYGIS